MRTRRLRYSHQKTPEGSKATLREGVNPPRKLHIGKGSQIPKGCEDRTLSQT